VALVGEAASQRNLRERQPWTFQKILRAIDPFSENKPVGALSCRPAEHAREVANAPPSGISEIDQQDLGFGQERKLFLSFSGKKLNFRYPDEQGRREISVDGEQGN